MMTSGTFARPEHLITDRVFFWLTIHVVGFFVLHTLLDFVRTELSIRSEKNRSMKKAIPKVQ